MHWTCLQISSTEAGQKHLPTVHGRAASIMWRTGIYIFPDVGYCLHEEDTELICQVFQILLQVVITVRRVNFKIQLGVICKFNNLAYSVTIQIHFIHENNNGLNIEPYGTSVRHTLVY